MYIAIISIFLVFLLIGLIVFFVYLGDFSRVTYMSRAKGKVLDLIEGNMGPGSSRYSVGDRIFIFPIVEFYTKDGQRIVFKDRNGTQYRSPYTRGSKVIVRYLPDNPEVARISLM